MGRSWAAASPEPEGRQKSRSQIGAHGSGSGEHACHRRQRLAGKPVLRVSHRSDGPAGAPQQWPLQKHISGRLPNSLESWRVCVCCVFRGGWLKQIIGTSGFPSAIKLDSGKGEALDLRWLHLGRLFDSPPNWHSMAKSPARWSFEIPPESGCLMWTSAQWPNSRMAKFGKSADF